jgi:hypothetical protein
VLTDETGPRHACGGWVAGWAGVCVCVRACFTVNSYFMIMIMINGRDSINHLLILLPLTVHRHAHQIQCQCCCSSIYSSLSSFYYAFPLAVLLSSSFACSLALIDLKTTIFWDVTSCRLVHSYRRFGESVLPPTSASKSPRTVVF